MAAILKNGSGTTISEKVLNALPGKDALKVTNRLLDGSYHIEVIGTAATMVEVDLIVTGTNKDLINGYEATAANVSLEFDQYYYTGVILERPRWSLIKGGDSAANRLYQGSILIAVSSEGVLT